MDTGVIPSKLPRDVFRLVCRFLTDLDTPRSLGVKILIEHGEWLQLCSLSLDPMHYLDTVNGARKFAHDYQATELLRKCSDLPSGFSDEDRSDAAMFGWLDAEERNAETNARLRPWLNSSYPALLDSRRAARIWNVIQTARKAIRSVIGRVPASIAEHCGFGPGAAKGVSSPVSGLPPVLLDKLSQQVMVTPSLKHISALLLPEAWLKCQRENHFSEPAICGYETFGCAKKNALTDRTIGTQPSGNLYLQKGVGMYFRQCLKTGPSRIDLDEGQAIHRSLAWMASLTNEDVTIDLRNASNSVVRILCKLLFEEEWFDVLDTFRTPGVAVNRVSGTARFEFKLRLEMMSAMGNGFTFELQTLLFWAIAQGVGADAKVYGDDIIVHRSHANDVISALRYFGFEVNTRKTFVAGPFRESCGGDYFIGFKNAPVRIQKIPTGPHCWVNLHNQLYRASRHLSGGTCDRAMAEARANLPHFLRRLGCPIQLGNQGLHGRPYLVKPGSGDPRSGDGIRLIKTIRWAAHPLFSLDRWGGEDTQLSAVLLGAVSPTSYTTKSGRTRFRDEVQSRPPYNWGIDEPIGFLLQWAPYS